MTHLTLDQLLELREPGSEPGRDAALAHLEMCPACRAEAERLDQRVARLRALPTPRPSRDRFLETRVAFVRGRRLKRLRRGGLAGLALAASLLIAFGLRSGPTPQPAVAAAALEDELAEIMARSQELERALTVYDPESRVLDGRTAGMVLRLEDQLGAVDRQLEMLSTLGRFNTARRDDQLRLWRERVGLLDALMDVHLTRASFAGL